MFKRALPAVRLCLSVLAAGTATMALSATDPQDGIASTAGSVDVVLGADLIRTGLYLISGGGGNSLLRLSASGSILVDGQLPGTYRAQMSQIRKISRLSDLPVRVLILTDHHESHAGNSWQFAAAGVPLIVQQNTRHRLPAGESAGVSAVGGRAPAPTVEYDDSYRLRMGGIEVQLFHFGSGCTDGDTVVYFGDLKVVALGDLFTTDAPVPDYSAGGSLVGWRTVLDRVLKLDFDVAVPGRGPIVTRAQVQAFRNRIDAELSREP